MLDCCKFVKHFAVKCAVFGTKKRLTPTMRGVIMTFVICEGAGIGRQARLRCVCQMAWGFKSPPSHQNREMGFCPSPYFYARSEEAEPEKTAMRSFHRVLCKSIAIFIETAGFIWYTKHNHPKLNRRFVYFLPLHCYTGCKRRASLWIRWLLANSLPNVANCRN